MNSAIMMKIAASGMSREELHKELGINAKSTPEEVKAAKRKYAIKNHPDKNPGNDEKFGKVMGAFDEHFDSDHRPKNSGSGPSASGGKPGHSGPEWTDEDKAKYRDVYEAQQRQREGIKKDLTGATKALNIHGNAHVAGGLASVALGAGSQHMAYKKLKAEGRDEEAEMMRKARNRSLIGSGIGAGVGALAGYMRGRKAYNERKGMYDAAHREGYGNEFSSVNKAILGNKMKTHGFYGANAGLMGGALLSHHKDGKRLGELGAAHEKAQREKRRQEAEQKRQEREARIAARAQGA